MSDHENHLYKAFLTLKNEDECRKFIADICTPAEIQALSERLHIASLLYKEQASYRDIAKRTGASTTTVGRVARFLSQEPHQGYKLVLDRLDDK